MLPIGALLAAGGVVLLVLSSPSSPPPDRPATPSTAVRAFPVLGPGFAMLEVGGAL
jgi:hypothetical protein